MRDVSNTDCRIFNEISEFADTEAGTLNSGFMGPKNFGNCFNLFDLDFTNFGPSGSIVAANNVAGVRGSPDDGE